MEKPALSRSCTLFGVRLSGPLKHCIRPHLPANCSSCFVDSTNDFPSRRDKCFPCLDASVRLSSSVSAAPSDAETGPSTSQHSQSTSEAGSSQSAQTGSGSTATGDNVDGEGSGGVANAEKPKPKSKGKAKSGADPEDVCIVRLNEFSTDSASVVSDAGFVELVLHCPQEVVGVGKTFWWGSIKFLIVRGGKAEASSKEPAHIVLFANLWNMKKTEINSRETYIVMGGAAIDQSKKTFSTSDATFVSYYPRSKTAPAKTLTSFFKPVPKTTQAPVRPQLPPGVFYPHAILVLNIPQSVDSHQKRTTTSILSPRPTRQETEVNAEIGAIFNKWAIDGVVYGRNCVSDGCGQLSKYIDAWKASNSDSPFSDKILRDFEPSAGTDQTSRSLSRCEAYDSFATNLYKSTEPTPLEPNKCEEGIQWYIEDFHAETRDAPLVPEADIEISLGASSSSSSSLLPVLPQATSDVINQKLQERQQKTSAEDGSVAELQSLSRENPLTESRMERAGTELRQALVDLSADEDQCRAAIEIDPSTSTAGPKRPAETDACDPVPAKVIKLASGGAGTNPLTDDSNFDSAWPAFLADNNLPGSTLWESAPKRKFWLELEANHDTPAESKFFCRLCRSNYKDVPLGNTKQELLVYATDGKTLGDANNNQIQRSVYRHGVSSVHQAVVTHLEKTMERALSDAKQKTTKQLLRENPLFATVNMFRLVYLESVSNVPFLQHELFCETLTEMGLNVGNIHRSRYSVVNIISHISKEFHRTLVGDIMKASSPISIIMDGSTDNMSNHYMAIFLRYPTVVENSLTLATVFYKLVPIVRDETADGMWNAVSAAFQEDNTPSKDFYTHLLRNLVGFTTDGASAMRSSDNGLLGKFIQAKRLVGHNLLGGGILAIHCFAHKLELSIDRAWKDLPFLTSFTDTINSIHRFYHNQGSKRIATLRHITNALNDVYYETHYIFQTRWVASSFLNVKRVLQMYKSLIVTFESIIADSSYNQEVKQKAMGLKNAMLSPRLLLHLHFIADVTKELQGHSKRFQSNKGVVIGQTAFIDTLKLNLRAIGQLRSAFSQEFLSTVRCGRSALSSKTGCTADEVQKSAWVKWKDLELKEPSSRKRTTEDFAPARLTNLLIDQIDKYFPFDTLAHLWIFEPNQLPPTHLVSGHGRDEIVVLAKFFGLAISNTWDEWNELLEVILSEPITKQAVRNQWTPRKFWLHWLQPTSGVTWGFSIKRLLLSILSVPVSSAQCERSFSYMNWRKSDRRSRLTPANVDRLLRLHLNGPKPKDFNALRYAKSWVATKHYKSDTVISRNTVQPEKEERERLEEAAIPLETEDSVTGIVTLEEDEAQQPTFPSDKADPDVPPIF